MSTVDDGCSSSPKPDSPPLPLSETVASVANDFVEKIKALEKDSVLPSIDYAVEQAQFARRTILDTVNDAIDVTKSRLERIRDTSSAHFNQTLDQLQYLKSDFDEYESLAVEQIKEGIYLAASHPLITAGSVLGVAVLGLKKPRHSLYYKILRHFRKEEVMLSKADVKFKELQTTVKKLNEEAEKLEKVTALAEDNMIRGRTKLRQAGKQIQQGVRSIYKIERKARGLKDVLEELPSLDASRFKAEVSNLAKEAKVEKNILNKEITKISNHGVSV